MGVRIDQPGDDAAASGVDDVEPFERDALGIGPEGEDLAVVDADVGVFEGLDFGGVGHRADVIDREDQLAYVADDEHLWSLRAW